LYDAATGLLYYDARWFDPFTNQFVSEDPLSFSAGDTNLRRYVGNSNPNAVDPSGMDYLTKEGKYAVWVIENETRGSIDGLEVGRIDLGVIDGDVVHLRPRFGGGTVPYSLLAGYVGAGLRHDELIDHIASLNEVSSDQHDFYIQFWIGEANQSAGNHCLRSGDRGDENSNVTSFAGAGGPLAAALIVQMMRQVAIDLAIEFGGAKALSVFSHGGKLIFKQGKDVVEVSAEEIAKKLGKKVDEINLDDIAKQFDGKTPTALSQIGKSAAYMNEFLADGFGKTLDVVSSRTNKRCQGQTIYKTNKKLFDQIKKGDHFYLDNLHKDHLEVFDSRGNFKFVLNLDGTINEAKSLAAKGRSIKDLL
jgi:RHS repeat-associated protein